MTLPAGCGLALTGTSVTRDCQPLKQNNCPASMAASSFSLNTPNKANGPCGNCSIHGEWGPRDRRVPARPWPPAGVCGGRLPCDPGHYSTLAKLTPPQPHFAKHTRASEPVQHLPYHRTDAPGEASEPPAVASPGLPLGASLSR